MLAAVVRSASLLLATSAVCAAAVSPAAIPSKANATAQLEALVSSMAAGQHAAENAPTPQKITDQDEEVVIFEGQERRRLGRCDCDVYRNGATAGSAVCSKVESGVKICTLQTPSGTCPDSAARACSFSTPDVRAQASPGPVFFDAETAPEEVYLNVALQLFNPHAQVEGSSLPAPDQFAQALARLTSSSAHRVNVITTWGQAIPAVRSTTAVHTKPSEGSETPGATATLHATIAVRSLQRRSALESLLQLTEELPEINGQSYQIRHLQVFEQASNALVCSADGDSAKADAAPLLLELVQLKRTEIELMRQGVAQISHSGNDSPLLRRIAARLGISLDEH